MVLARVRQRIRLSGPNPALESQSNGWPGAGPLRFVSGPDRWPKRSASGVAVNDESALGLTTVYRCVVLISTVVGGQPIHIYKTDGGEKVRAEDDSNAYLWDRPNPEMTNQTFWETVVGHEVMGDAFLFVVKSGRGEPLELWYIEPWRVVTGRATNGRKVYLVDNEEVLVDFADGGEIIHVPNWSRTPLRGVSPISVAAEAIALGISSQSYADRFFGADQTPSGLLTTDQDLTQEQADELQARWAEKHSGPNASHRTSVLANGAKFQAISVNPHDAQLLEERTFQKSEIATLFGVPPWMVGDLTHASQGGGSGLEDQFRNFLSLTLQAHINRFEQAINYALLRRRETRRYVKFDMTGLLRPNALQQAQLLDILVKAGILAPNEARKDLDRAPLPGGDSLILPMNMTPAEQLGQPPDGGA